MNKQKKANALGILFIVTIAVYILLSIVIQVLALNGMEMSTNVLLIISELIIVVPGIIYIFVNKLSLGDGMGFKKIKTRTFFLSILLGFVIMPIASFINILTQFFVSNTMTQASDELLGGSYVMLLLVSGVWGPLCEEFMFRGIFHREYDRISKPFRAILLSALFFGIMHLNFNQFCYAFVIGIVFAIVNKVTDSIYPSIIMHIVINTFNVLILILSDVALKMAGADVSIAESSEALRNDTASLVMLSAGYLVAALICAGIYILIVSKMAKIEERSDVLRDIFNFKKNISEEQEEEKLPRILFNVPTVIVIIVGIILTFNLFPGL